MVLTLSLLANSYIVLYAQQDKVRYISDLYDYVKYKIEDNAYQTLVMENTESTNGGREVFYYSFAGDDTPILRLIITKSTDGKLYKEYLYDNDGNMIFYIEKGGSTAYQQLKVYFEKGNKLIEIWQDNKSFHSIIIEESKHIKAVLSEAESYAVIFAEKMKK